MERACYIAVIFNECSRIAGLLLALERHRLGRCARKPIAEELPLLDIAGRTVSNENI